MARIEFEGNLGSPPEMRFTPAGSSVLSFRVADSKSKKNDSGGWDKVSEQWLNVSVWGSLGELLADKLDKGTRVRVIGEFYAREYEGKNGPGISLDVKAWGVEVLSKGRTQQQNTQQPAQSQGWGGQQQAAASNWGAPAVDPWGPTDGSDGPPF